MEEKIVRLSNLYTLYVLYSIERGDARAIGARRGISIAFSRPVTISYVEMHDTCPMMIRNTAIDVIGATIDSLSIALIDRYMNRSTVTIAYLTGVCICIDALKYLINLIEIYRTVRSDPSIVTNKMAIRYLEEEASRALDILSIIASIAREIPDRKIIDMAEEMGTNERSRASIEFVGSDSIDIDESRIHVNRYFRTLSIEHVSSNGTKTVLDIEPKYNGTIETRIHVDRRTAEKALDAAINKVIGVIRTLIATKIAINMLR